ncbi:arp2 3 complex 34 kda subunit [Micractinium conductrix]|uniref:Arp2 3 complex 34 kDa subunit n=1 Tax=Micractinium conductrix TaxID=554055 RepID=A0A2P6VBU1_9CHLO|nr:arp2 3 complex 34 kda subunit [Micractinium conductrix]|eukprot:PSC71554.1 arp2 3 complex 34 kda subunit [Micractinium conductrix]
MAQPHHWLAPLADSRQAGGGEQGPATTLQRRRGPGGLPTVALELRAASDSNGGGAASGGGPVGQLLLNAFLEATTPSARGRAGQQPAGGALQRGLEITLAQERGGEGQRAGDERPALRLQFAATEPAAAEQVEEATRLFEAFWQYHSKAAQSHLHSRMRARLGSLRQRLALARFDGT